MRAVLCAVLLLAPACFPLDDGARCRTDRDCNEVCADNGECASADAVRAARIEWTIAGVQPTPLAPQPCIDAGVDEMTLRISTGSSSDALTYEPVPCEVGQFSFSALPLRYDQVHLTVRGPGGTLLGTGSAILAEGQPTVSIDLL